MSQVVILHGWSDKSSSFKPLAEFLQANGYDAIPIWLGDYKSLDDDVRIEDVGKRMESVLRQLIDEGPLEPPFDLIVHSTGGLVAREWLSAHYAHDMGACPVKRLIMLAPANFGSRLASTGKSLVGRVIKGWDNWFASGAEMLTALELSSSYQWNLAQRDLFVPEHLDGAPALYGADGVWPFILTGTHPYTSRLRQIVNENGGDGTVRACAANLNTRGLTIDFSSDEDQPVLTPWRLRDDSAFPFAVLADRTHSSIIKPEGSDVNSSDALKGRLRELLLAALGCDDFATYRQMATDWHAVSEETAALAHDEQRRRDAFSSRSQPEAEFFHQYMQVNVRVVDDHGNDVHDYFLEFSGPDDERGDDSSVYFHREVLEHVHTFGGNASQRCLYLDRTDLRYNYYEAIRGDVARVLNMSLSAAPPGDNVRYFDSFRTGARGMLPLHFEDQDEDRVRWLKRNTTHFVKIVIPRQPREQVFKLKSF